MGLIATYHFDRIPYTYDSGIPMIEISTEENRVRLVCNSKILLILTVVVKFRKEFPLSVCGKCCKWFFGPLPTSLICTNNRTTITESRVSLIFSDGRAVIPAAAAFFAVGLLDLHLRLGKIFA